MRLEEQIEEKRVELEQIQQEKQGIVVQTTGSICGLFTFSRDDLKE